MIKRFNYTDRQKILRSQIRLAWIEDGSGVLRFSVELDLNFDKRPLAPDAIVFLEAYSGPTVMRFSCGSVGNLEYPEGTLLSDFPPGLKPLFRVKVVSPDADRRLLAWADAVSPLAADEVKSGRRSILPVETVDLGPKVWFLRIESNTFFLQLNSSIREPRDITVLAKEPDFIALVYPAVIRQILAHLLLGPESDSVEDDHSWLVFATQLAGRTPPKNHYQTEDEDAYGDEVNEWIDNVIEAFCAENHAMERFIQAKKEAEENNA
jgi:hypothetical protein